MDADDSEATVLVVDDEPAYRAAFSNWLEDVYEVRTASDGPTALGAVDTDVDVVLLDRRMPGLSGDEVLERIRDREADCRVAIVTAATPSVDVVDMPFDQYLTKPVRRDELRGTIDRLLTRARLDESTQRCYALAAKKVTLEAALDRSALEASPEYRRLCEELDRAERDADQALDHLLAEGVPAAGYIELGP